MFIPITLNAADVFASADLTRPAQCMCGKDVTLGDCLVCWTHPSDKPKNLGWFPACTPMCIFIHVAEGRC